MRASSASAINVARATESQSKVSAEVLLGLGPNPSEAALGL